MPRGKLPVAVLPSAGDAPGAHIPLQPTHVVIAPSAVFERAEGRSAQVQNLSPGMLVAGRLPATRRAAFTRGLARPPAAEGTFIAFATQPDQVADDGRGRNSPFTAALLKHLSTPGLELRTLLARVRAEVVQSTGGKQWPEVWDSLLGEFAFKETR